MARTLFGGGEASYFLPGTGSTAVVYGTEAGAKAKTPADVVSDLLAADAVTAQSQIVARGIGTYSFYGPDGRTSPLWVSDGVGGAIRIDPNPAATYASISAAWAANTAYAKDQLVVEPGGTLVRAKAAFTSGSAYSAANWTTVASGGSGGGDTVVSW